MIINYLWSFFIYISSFNIFVYFRCQFDVYLLFPFYLFICKTFFSSPMYSSKNEMLKRYTSLNEFDMIRNQKVNFNIYSNNLIHFLLLHTSNSQHGLNSTRCILNLTTYSALQVAFRIFYLINYILQFNLAICNVYNYLFNLKNLFLYATLLNI